jgi:PAS domain S-box-containing protein
VDPSGHIVYANRKASELLGYSRDELLGMHVQKLYAPEIWEKVQKGFASLKDHGSLTVHDSLICDKQGNVIPVEIRSFAVYDEDGSFLRTFSILRDVRQLRDLQNELIHASRLSAIGELSACIVHDISNPLAVVKLYMDLVQMQIQDVIGGNLSEVSSLQDAVVNVQKSAEKIEKLITHLREFCRSRDTQMEMIDLQQVLGDALFMVTGKIEKNGVKVRKEFTGTACMIKGNSGQLEQLFMNLMSNACDAMKKQPPREILLAIRLSTNPALPDFWECEVRDSGCGIPPELQDKIFTPFFTTKPKGEGTGLGLSITRNVIRRHGGDITVRSEVGKGTSFLVFLPKPEATPLVAPEDDTSGRGG